MSAETLFEGFRLRVVRVDAHAVVIDVEPRYAEAGFAALIGVPFALLLLADWLLLPREESLFHKITADGSFTAYAMYAAFMVIPVMIVGMCILWGLHACFRRQFTLADKRLRFRGVLGTTFSAEFADIEGVALDTVANNRGGPTCRISFVFREGLRYRRLCVNHDQICTPAAWMAHRGQFQTEWVLEQHFPLAELLASLVDKPVRTPERLTVLTECRGLWP